MFRWVNGIFFLVLLEVHTDMFMDEMICYLEFKIIQLGEGESGWEES